MDTANTSESQSDTLGRLEALAQAARPLAPDAAARRQALEKVAAYTESYLEELGRRPVYESPGDAAETLRALRLSEQGGSVESALSLLHEHVSTNGQTLGSDRFFAYIPSGGLYSSALGDFLAAVVNRYAGVGFAAPGAARLEKSLLNWLAELVGYPAGSEGDLTSGGSMATLSAVVTAREAHGIDSRRVVDTVVYLTRQMHHTFAKSLRIAGLGDCVLRDVPMDSSLRMDVDELRKAIVKDRQAGLSPWMIAAAAGSTDVGAVDPLERVAEVAADERLWFHVDAAYGGAFALCAEGRRRLAGIEQSDSLILDPHKGFFLPSGSGVVLVRDGQKMRDAFRARGAYMQDMYDDPERSACDLSPELTRPFRGLRFWLPFKLLGIAPFRAALEEKLLLAAYFRDRMLQEDNCELGPGPDLSIVTFRYTPPGHDANEFNRRLVDTLREDGRIFLTSTTIGNRFILRMAILGYNTHLDSVNTAIDVIRETASRLIHAKR